MVYAEGRASHHCNSSTELLPYTPLQPSPLPSLLLRTPLVVSGIHLFALLHSFVHHKLYIEAILVFMASRQSARESQPPSRLDDKAVSLTSQQRPVRTTKKRTMSARRDTEEEGSNESENHMVDNGIIRHMDALIAAQIQILEQAAAQDCLHKNQIYTGELDLLLTTDIPASSSATVVEDDMFIGEIQSPFRNWIIGPLPGVPIKHFNAIY
jgi:hypothetical protein